MPFESTAGKFQQLWRRLEVDLGAEHVLVAEISRQPRQLGVNVHPLVRPGREAMYRESVSELVRARSSPSTRRLHAKVPKQPSDCIRGRCDGQRRGIQPQE